MQTGPFRMQATCSQCGGSGKIASVCSTFRFLFIFQFLASIFFFCRNYILKKNPSCKFGFSLGKKLFQNFCKSCNGERVVRKLKSVKLDIKPGNCYYWMFNLLRVT